MKLFSIIMLTVSIIFIFSGCVAKEPDNISSSSQNTSSTTSENDFSVIQNGDSKDIEDIEMGTEGGEFTLQKYRSIYYSIPAPFWDIIDENSRNNLYGNYWETPYNEINIMRMKIFVEEYNIPREKFDLANAEWARIIKERLYGKPIIDPQDFSNQEFNEIYNADIIYTFDDEIINNYYLSHDYPYCYESEFEEAVAKGEYTPRTEVWVDVEQLEAEIIAKYGETEIIPEEPTDIPEVTDALPQESESTQVTEAVTT